jgi:outer membrane receptor protein involved in Fe transport
MNKLSKVLLGTFASFALAVPFFVSAQEVEEVVVTATKKAESVQDLALSIEAFTAEDMEKNLIKDASDLQEVVPGLIADKGIGSGVSYAIRGTGSYGVGAAVVGAVVTSMNGHSVGTGAFYDLGFYDTEDLAISCLLLLEHVWMPTPPLVVSLMQHFIQKYLHPIFLRILPIGMT